MTRLEKVLSGFKCCRGHNDYSCFMCPYGGNADCLRHLHEDAYMILNKIKEVVYDDEGTTLF